MDWIGKLCGIPSETRLNISIPKETLMKNIQNEFLKMKMTYEWGNIQDIIYHAIFRDRLIKSRVDELHIIEVELVEPQYVRVIAEVFQRTIPYRQIIIFSSGEKHLLFHSYVRKKEVKHYQFSDWVYEEELLADFSLGTERKTENYISADDSETWWDLDYQFSELFYRASGSEFICLRHLIDMLKIREITSGRKYVRSIIAPLVNRDAITYINDMPFALLSDADHLYLARNPYMFDGGIIDRRYGPDRYFEMLQANDFTTQSDVEDLLREVEYLPLYADEESDSIEDEIHYYAEEERRSRSRRSYDTQLEYDGLEDRYTYEEQESFEFGDNCFEEEESYLEDYE